MRKRIAEVEPVVSSNVSDVDETIFSSDQVPVKPGGDIIENEVSTTSGQQTR